MYFGTLIRYAGIIRIFLRYTHYDYFLSDTDYIFDKVVAFLLQQTTRGKFFIESLKILFKTKEIIHLYLWNIVFMGSMFITDNLEFLYYVREFKVSYGLIGVCLFFKKPPELSFSTILIIQLSNVGSTV